MQQCQVCEAVAYLPRFEVTAPLGQQNASKHLSSVAAHEVCTRLLDVDIVPLDIGACRVNRQALHILQVHNSTGYKTINHGKIRSPSADLLVHCEVHTARLPAAAAARPAPAQTISDQVHSLHGAGHIRSCIDKAPGTASAHHFCDQLLCRCEARRPHRLQRLRTAQVAAKLALVRRQRPQQRGGGRVQRVRIVLDAARRHICIW